MNNLDRIVFPEPISYVSEPNALQRVLMGATNLGLNGFNLRNPDYGNVNNGLSFFPDTIGALDYINIFKQNNPSVAPIVISDFDGVLKPFPLFSRIKPEVKDAFRGLHDSGVPTLFNTNRAEENLLLFRTGTIKKVLNEMGIDPNLYLFAGLDQQVAGHSILRNQRMAGEFANRLFLEVTNIIKSGKEPRIFALMDIKPELGGLFSALLGLQAPFLNDVLFTRPPFNNNEQLIKKLQIEHLAIF